MMNDKELKELVDKKWDVELEWCEPWAGVDAFGNMTNTHVTMSATVADCIRMTRYSRYQTFKKESSDKDAFNKTETLLKVTTIPDEELLYDFIVVNWAEVKETKEK